MSVAILSHFSCVSSTTAGMPLSVVLGNLTEGVFMSFGCPHQ